MHYDPRYKIEKVISKDPTRTNLLCVNFDATRKVLEATNGHSAVIVPCEVDAGDIAGPISEAAIKHSKTAKRMSRNLVLLHKAGVEALFDGTERRRPDVQCLELAHVNPGLTPGDAGTLSITLDAKLLWELSQALGCPGGDGEGVTLTVKVDKEGRVDEADAIQVHPSKKDAAYGIIMPMRRGA